MLLPSSQRTLSTALSLFALFFRVVPPLMRLLACWASTHGARSRHKERPRFNPCSISQIPNTMMISRTCGFTAWCQIGSTYTATTSSCPTSLRLSAPMIFLRFWTTRRGPLRVMAAAPHSHGCRHRRCCASSPCVPGRTSCSAAYAAPAPPLSSTSGYTTRRRASLSWILTAQCVPCPNLLVAKSRSSRLLRAVVDLSQVTKSDVRGYAESVYAGIYTYTHEGVAGFLQVRLGPPGCTLLTNIQEGQSLPPPPPPPCRRPRRPWA